MDFSRTLAFHDDDDDDAQLLALPVPITVHTSSGRNIMSAALQVQFSQLIVGAYQVSAAGLLQGANSKFLEQEKFNTKLRVDKGQVDAENDQKYQTLKENLQKAIACCKRTASCVLHIT
eukprot:4367267-Amphidinium_carterae.1